MSLSAANRLVEPVSQQDHVLGPADAPVTLVEYGDFECPSCGQAYPIVKQVRRLMGDQLRFCFREFPLNQIHPYAEQAAEAAEAAGAQGKFWPMHDMLFEHQQALTIPDLERYAAELGLDQQRFSRDLREHTFAGKVAHDKETGLESGVQGTPTFYINGYQYEGSYDPQTLLAVLRQAAENG